MSGLGRPTKFTEAVRNSLFDSLRKGLSREDACIIANIGTSTLYQYMSENMEFAEEIKRAEYACKIQCIEHILKASKKLWTAAAWWLERKHRDEFGLRHVSEVSFSPKNEPVTDDALAQGAIAAIRALPEDKIKMIADEIGRRTKEQKPCE